MKEEPTRLLLAYRKPLFAYIYTLLRDHHAAEDVFQEVSVAVLHICEREDVANFWGLAKEVARRQALAAVRKQQRIPAALSPEAIEAIDRGFDAVAEGAEGRQEALRGCIRKLPEAWQRIVRLRFWEGMAVAAIAAQLARTQDVVSVTLNRIRSRLLDCVRQQLRAGEAG